MLFSSARLLSSLTLLVVTVPPIHAQQPGTSVELGITFAAQRSLQEGTAQNFWAEGGAVELGANAFRGVGLGADLEGVQTSSLGSSGTPLSLVVATFGPRYRWHEGHHVSIYGEGLLGEANAFNSLFPSAFGAQSTANALAVRVGGGVDLRLRRHLAIRLLDAAWLRTQFPNGTSDVQNNLVLGAGLVFRTGR